MIKILLIGAALGVLGKKLYDEGKLDPYMTKAKSRLDEARQENKGSTSSAPAA